MLVRLQDIKIGNRFRKELGDISFLANSIEKNGLLHPIVITDEKELVSGRRRIEAFTKLGRTEIETHILRPPNSSSNLNEAQADENIVRKAFTVEEIAAVDEFYREKEETDASERQRCGKPRPGPVGNFPEGRSRSREKIAIRVGVSDRTLEKIRVLKEAATKDPETYGSFWDKVKLQKISIDKAYRKVKQRIIIQEARKSALDLTGNKSSIESRSKYDLKLGDMREKGRELEEDSVDLIFTDPPYDQESIPLYGELAKVAQRVLKPGGSLITFIGHYALFEIGKQVEAHSSLKYHWLLIVKQNGRITRTWKQRIWPRYKPLLWYYKPNGGKGPTMFKDISDLIESQPAKKEFHPWEQSPVEAAHVLGSLTVENQIVLDPLMGYGTTGIACLQLKRKFIGIEIDELRYSDAVNRLTNI